MQRMMTVLSSGEESEEESVELASPRKDERMNSFVTSGKIEVGDSECDKFKSIKPPTIGTQKCLQ